MKKAYRTYLPLILLLFIAATKPSSYINELTAKQKAGKDIYTKGIGSSNVKITANMSGVNVPATIMPCMNCHNAKGTGNPEGGITPPNITWQALTKNYDVKRQDGETRPPYTEKSLRKVITTGIDPAGNALHSAMPKYNMTRQDIDNLIAYLKVIDTDQGVGISQGRIKMGFALPDAESTKKNATIKKLVQAYTNEVNQSGGIYNRKIEIEFYSKNTLEKEDDIFMLTGFNDTYNATNRTTPTLLSHSKKLVSSSLDTKNTFYIYPSLMSQSLALVTYSNKRLKQKGSSPTILYYGNTFQKQVAQNMEAKLVNEFNLSPFTSEINESNLEDIVQNNAIRDDQALYFIGPYHIGNKLLTALDNIKKRPYIYLPGSIASLDVLNAPQPFKDNIFIGYPTWISKRAASGEKLYKTLKEKYALDAKWKNSQLDALIMLLTIEESLKRSGQNLNQELFHGELEGLYEFSTGFIQPITFAPNKHIGSTTMYITNFDSNKNRMKLIATVNSSERRHE